MYRPVFVLASAVGLIVVGLAVYGVAPLVGAVVTVAGAVLFLGFLAFVVFHAWRGDQWNALRPGSVHREYRDEQAAKRR